MYDIIYIGGGLNYAGAIVAAKKGLKVALIEKDLERLGGACLHQGCIPSKMFLHHANIIYESDNDAIEGEIRLNIKTLVEKKSKLIKSATKAVTAQCSGFELIEGEGRVIDAGKVSVGEKVYEAKHIVMGTGSSPFIPEGIVYDGKRVITSDEVLELQALPKAICIYGMGAIGLEMASFFSAAGVKVTLISHSSGILKNAHPLIQEGLGKQLENMQITLLHNHKIVKTKVLDDGLELSFENGEKLSCETLLVASGRKPNTSVAATEKIEVGRGIETDECFETSLKDHYAVGDCNGKLQLAHAARAQVLNVTSRILAKPVEILDLDHVVKFIHTLPMSYASVGQSKEMLLAKDIIHKESIISLNNFTASAFHHARDGKMMVYADEKGLILGAEILAPDAEELISTVAMALAGKMDASMASKTIMAHPTFSEALERSYFRL